MELRQQFDINTTSKVQKSSADKNHSTESDNVDSKQNKPFKDQFNEQVEQTKKQEKRQNTDNNQQDERLASGGDRVDDESAGNANADGIKKALDDEAAVEAKGQLDAANALQDDDMTNSLIATHLPEAGSALPFSNALASLQTQAGADLSQSKVAGVAMNTATVTPSATSDIELSSQRISDLLNKTSSTQASQSTDLINADLRTTKVVTASANLTTTLSEKANIQDARYSKLMSEMPAADVITQTTRMQQVPFTTAMSASQASIQNISNALITEPANSLTGPTQLSNTLSTSIATNLQNPNWSQQMTQQVAYMIKGGFQQADIKLNPAHLGPMEIKLTLNDDNANVNFVTQHAAVRDAIDAALPRLKEMLEQQGLNLSDANVSTQSEQKQANAESQQDSDDAQSDSVSDNTEISETSQQASVNVEINSGVSIFA